MPFDTDETTFTEQKVNEYECKFAKVALLDTDLKLNSQQILLEWVSIHALSNVALRIQYKTLPFINPIYDFLPPFFPFSFFSFSLITAEGD